MGVQVEGSGPGGRGVGGRRGPSHLEGGPLDPSGLRVVGAQKAQSQDEVDHEEGLEVVSSQEVGAQDSRASATKSLWSNINNIDFVFIISVKREERAV